MRLVTPPVTQTTSHSGLMLPGHRVDVLCTYKMRGATKTRTLLQYIEVAAADQLRDPSASDMHRTNSKNVSLFVTPEQANLLMQAKNKGTIHLALRSMSDTEEVDVTTIDDAFFDGTHVAKFGRIEEEGPELESDDVRSSLLSELQHQSGEAQPPEPEPATPQWEITIFEGTERRGEQVDLDEPAPAAAGLPAAVSAPMANLLRGLIQQYFAAP